MPSQSVIKYNTPSQPRQVRIDSTTSCQARCLSCHRQNTKRQGQMSLETIGHILDDIARWETPLTEIIPVNYGELFLHPQWQQILAMIAQKLPRTQVVIPTNGKLLQPDKLVFPNIKIINFSINAFFDETYERFTGLPAENLDYIKDCMIRLKVLRPDIMLWASFVFDPIYATDLERDLFIEHWKGIAYPWILSRSSCNLGHNPLVPVTLPCRSIFSDIVIGYDGKLGLCCFDADFNLDLGYYSSDLLKDWNNKKIKKLRRIHNEGNRQEYELCKSCTSA